jgi:hypothetical protein
MTSNQIIHMSRVRGALREMGIQFEPKIAVLDLEYLHLALVSAIEHPNSDVQESALCLAADFGLADGMRDVPFDPVTAPSHHHKSSIPHEASVADIQEFTTEESDPPAPEPAALAFTPERQAVMRRYVGGMR